jgi:hypothetical protein
VVWKRWWKRHCYAADRPWIESGGADHRFLLDGSMVRTAFGVSDQFYIRLGHIQDGSMNRFPLAHSGIKINLICQSAAILAECYSSGSIFC